MLAMQVAELIGTRRFQIVERDLADPGPGEVQVRVEAVGVCGSDMHSFSEGSVGDQICRYPMVLGHEPSGVVVKAGAGVTGWQRGDRAALEPAIYCYHCEFCLSGHHNVCANIRFLSSVDDPGFFRDRLNLPARNLLPLAPGTALGTATLVEPLAIALHSLKFAPPQLGDAVAVFGAGPIGLLTIGALRLAGAKRIFAVEPVTHRREMAIRIGADEALDPAQADPVTEIRRATGGRGVDAAYDCAAKEGRSPEAGTLDQAVSAVRNRGAVVLTGIHSAARISLNPHTLRRKEVALFPVRRSNHESELARDMLASEERRFAPVITHERPLDRIEEAFTLNETYQDGVGKLVIRPAI